MHNSQIRFIGLDLDGTLLTPDKTISPRTRTAIQKCTEKGILLVPITGRPAHGLPSCVREIPEFGYAITSNGALTQELTTGVTLASHEIPPKTTAKIIDCTRQYDVSYEIFQNGYGYTTQYTYDQLLRKYQGTPLLSYITDSRRPLPDLDTLTALCLKPVEGISILCKQRCIRNQIHQKLIMLPDIQIVYPNPMNLEINHSMADKGRAMLSLAEHLGIRPDAILAIGDSDNDRTMLAQAGIGIAMGNATARLRSTTHYTTQDNAHDGVAIVLEHLLT